MQATEENVCETFYLCFLLYRKSSNVYRLPQKIPFTAGNVPFTAKQLPLTANLL